MTEGWGGSGVHGQLISTVGCYLLCIGNAHYIYMYDYRPIICTFEFACSASHWQLPTVVVIGQRIYMYPAFLQLPWQRVEVAASYIACNAL